MFYRSFYPRLIKYDSGVRIKLKFLPYGFKNIRLIALTDREDEVESL